MLKIGGSPQMGRCSRYLKTEPAIKVLSLPPQIITQQPRPLPRVEILVVLADIKEAIGDYGGGPGLGGVKEGGSRELFETLGGEV